MPDGATQCVLGRESTLAAAPVAHSCCAVGHGKASLDAANAAGQPGQPGRLLPGVCTIVCTCHSFKNTVPPEVCTWVHMCTHPCICIESAAHRRIKQLLHVTATTRQQQSQTSRRPPEACSHPCKESAARHQPTWALPRPAGIDQGGSHMRTSTYAAAQGKNNMTGRSSSSGSLQHQQRQQWQ